MLKTERCLSLAGPCELQGKVPVNVTEPVEHPAAQNRCCVGYYRLVDGEPVAEYQGCYVLDMPCPYTGCIMLKYHKSRINCACSSDLCNGTISWNATQNLQLETEKTQRRLPDGVGVKVAVVVVVGILVLLGTLLAADMWRKRSNHDGRASSLQGHSLVPNIPDLDLSNVELLQVIGRGHFACVWRGLHQGCEVAMKVFPAGCKPNFTTEREVYELPLMVHAGIASFQGAGRLEGGEMVLLLELAAFGSLHSFLAKCTTDWVSSLRLARSLSEGLAFLHSDLFRHGEHKPPVAHRDLSSSNVLVRSDGTCALSDFSCSTILHTWHSSRATGQGIVQVGTLCYMSPEILEGSVNLNSSLCLLQGDVYALSLVLWEIWTRCSDLYTDRPVPQHVVPYEAELGACPSLESLLLHVAERKQRPPIPVHWPVALQGFSLQEILMDCWDHDPDARLTSECALNRLLSLQPCVSI